MFEMTYVLFVGEVDCITCEDNGYHYYEVGGYDEHDGGGIDWSGYSRCDCPIGESLPDNFGCKLDQHEYKNSHCIYCNEEYTW